MIELRPLIDADRPLLTAWMAEPRAAPWWSPSEFDDPALAHLRGCLACEAGEPHGYEEFHRVAATRSAPPRWRATGTAASTSSSPPSASHRASRSASRWSSEVVGEVLAVAVDGAGARRRDEPRDDSARRPGAILDGDGLAEVWLNLAGMTALAVALGAFGLWRMRTDRPKRTWG